MKYTSKISTGCCGRAKIFGERGVYMNQRFIPLGQGYTDVYELMTLGQQMSKRVQHFLLLNTVKDGKKKISLAIVMSPTEIGEFQPIYICLEGISGEKECKRLEQFKELAKEFNKEPIELVVQPSTYFGDLELYFQHLIGILRANHIIKPLTLPF